MWFRKRLPKLTGHIDILDRYHVAGWAAYTGGIAPQLIIKVDEKKIDIVVPKYRRSDLMKLYGTNVDLGFFIVSQILSRKAPL